MNSRPYFLVLFVAFVAGIPVPARAQFSFGRLRRTLKEGEDAVRKAKEPTKPTAVGHPKPVASGPSAATAAPPLKANVQEKLLGPSTPQGAFVVSPDGGHMAISAMHGSREIVILDGVDGPGFDHAAHPNGVQAIDVAFSRDGKRSAYVAQSGGNWVAVIDGKVAYTIGTTQRGGTVPAINPTFFADKQVGHQFLISPSGAHLACVSEAGGLNQPWHVFLDGVKSPAYREVDLRQMAFVREKLVYAARTADGKWHMMVNGKLDPSYDSITSLKASDDHQHYAFIASVGGNSRVIADGVPGPVHPGTMGRGIHGLVIASNGRIAYRAYEGPAKHMLASREALYVDNRRVSSQTSTFSSTDKSGVLQPSVYVIFSPDGKKFAYAKPVPGGIATVIDGKQSLAYDSIGQMQFSPDSRRAFFVGIKNVTQRFVVIDGQEMPAQDTVKEFVFSQDGSRFGYEGFKQGRYTMVVDGKPSQIYLNVIDKSLTFSADGKHSVYAGCTQYFHCEVVEDGNSTSVPGLYTFQTQSAAARIVFPPFLFSPDGTRLAYGYPKRSDGANQNVIVINGQEISHGVNFTYRCFSPDSKHFATALWTGKGYSIFVDGKLGPTYDKLVGADANPKVFRFLDAHTLRFLGVKGGSVYRVTVTLGN